MRNFKSILWVYTWTIVSCVPVPVLMAVYLESHTAGVYVTTEQQRVVAEMNRLDSKIIPEIALRIVQDMRLASSTVPFNGANACGNAAVRCGGVR